VLLLPSGPPDPLHQPKRQHPGNEVIHHEPELDSGFAGSRLADGRSGNRRSAPLTGRPRRPTQQPGPAGSASQPGYCSGWPPCGRRSGAGRPRRPACLTKIRPAPAA